MRLPTLMMAALVVLSPGGVFAQADLVNCEDFGFNAPMSCLDGAQPTAGPVPSEADMAEPTDPTVGTLTVRRVTPGILVPF